MLREIVPIIFMSILGILHMLFPDSFRRIRWSISETFGYKAIKDNYFNSIAFYRFLGILYFLGAIILLIVALNNE